MIWYDNNTDQIILSVFSDFKILFKSDILVTFSSFKNECCQILKVVYNAQFVTYNVLDRVFGVLILRVTTSSIGLNQDSIGSGPDHVINSCWMSGCIVSVLNVLNTFTYLLKILPPLN